jgi:epoxyqueuosine reductase
MLPPLTAIELTARIRARAREMGFGAVGFAPVHASEQASAYRAWLGAGMHGEMAYMERPDAVAKRSDPAVLVPGARSAVVVAMEYAQPTAEPEPDPSRGVVARYARGDDYHDLMKERLIALQAWIDEELMPVRGRAYVDTGPVLERELAARAGIGWQARNTMLIQPGGGSYWFLGTILLDVELAYDEPFAADRCGNCAACVAACPTGALLGRDAEGAPRMDARRCISYLTIELRGPIPRELRPLIGNRIYGCDICQEVCPFSRKFSTPTTEPAFMARPGVHGAPLTELMSLSQEEFSALFKGSPVKRAKRRGFLRNVAVALSNWGSPEAIPSLLSALDDSEPLVRGHAAWALGQIASGSEISEEDITSVSAGLARRLAVEEDPWVREEVSAAFSS